MPACCNWCNRFVVEPKDYDRRKQRLYCSPNCYMLDWIFGQWQSDELLNKLRHYKELTKGDDDGSSSRG